MDYRIKKILARIENNLAQPLVVKQLAASVRLSVSRFQHLFKHEVKSSVIKYTNNLRLERARDLLETTYLHVKEIRLKVGLKNESHFLHNFKQKFGSTPKDYRKNQSK